MAWQDSNNEIRMIEQGMAAAYCIRANFHATLNLTLHKTIKLKTTTILCT